MPPMKTPDWVSCTWNLAGVSEAGSICLLKNTVTGALVGTLTALLSGLVRTTVGGVKSLNTAVVKLLWNCGVVWPPATSWTTTVYTVVPARLSVGVNVSERPSLERTTLPATGVAPWSSVSVPGTTALGDTGEAKRTTTWTLSGTLAPASAG